MSDTYVTIEALSGVISDFQDAIKSRDEKIEQLASVLTRLDSALSQRQQPQVQPQTFVMTPQGPMPAGPHLGYPQQQPQQGFHPIAQVVNPGMANMSAEQLALMGGFNPAMYKPKKGISTKRALLYGFGAAATTAVVIGGVSYLMDQSEKLERLEASAVNALPSGD